MVPVKIDYSDRTPVVGFARPLPWAPSFVFPVFQIYDVHVVQDVSPDDTVRFFRPIALGEEFFAITEPNSIWARTAEPAIYAIWLPDQSVIAAPRSSLGKRLAPWTGDRK